MNKAITALAVKPDGRRIVVVAYEDIWTEDATVQRGPFWRPVTRDGLPAGLICGIYVSMGGTATVLFKTGQLFELPRNTYSALQWREVMMQEIPDALETPARREDPVVERGAQADRQSRKPR